MANLLKNLEVSCVSLVDRAAVRDHANPTEPQRFLIWKREAATNEGGEMPTIEEATAALAKAEKENVELREQLKSETDTKAALVKAEKERDEALAKAAKPEEKPEPKIDLEKADPAIRALLEKAETDRVALADRLEKAEKQAKDSDELAKAERDERLTRDFIAKAEKDFRGLSIEPAKFGPVLKAAAEKLTKDEFDALETVLKASDEQIRKGTLFQEQGRGGDGQKTGALLEAQQKAEEIRKADPKLSPEQALANAMQSDPELQARYIAERG